MLGITAHEGGAPDVSVKGSDAVRSLRLEGELKGSGMPWNGLSSPSTTCMLT
jgi:hypothetical protein